MAIPNQTITVLKNGIGTVQSTVNNILVLSPALSSSIGEIKLISSVQVAKNLYGSTPIAELTSFIASFAGQVYGLSLPATLTTLTNQSMTKVGTGTATITLSGQATMDYDIKFKITDGYTYQFSLDGGQTYSATRKLVGSGTYVLPDTGVTATFGILTNFVSGDVYSYTTIGPKLTSSDLAAAFNLIKQGDTQFQGVIVYDGKKLVADSATLFAALKTQLESMTTLQIPMWGIMGYGELTTLASDVVTSLGTIESDKISVDPSTSKIYSALAREGYSYRTESVYDYAARVAKCLLSEDPAQVDRGPLDSVGITNDESVNTTFSDSKAVTKRRFRGKPGYYVTESHVKSDPGADIQFIQHRRVMDEAIRTVVATQVDFIKRPTRVKSDGTIFETDKADYEAKVKNAIEAKLMSPKNSAGTKGHISAFSYVIDDSNNLLKDSTINATLSIQPLGYPKFIVTTISFVATI